MDYPPSFSLGITQLDAKEKDISLGFVPSTFDEQDPKFVENQSKHRNDPVTMRKLKKVAAFRSKKSGSKAASKKKFDDSGRPRLSKHSYKNIQPTIEEVRRLNVSFFEDFKTVDPATAASTSVAGMLKRSADEVQQRIDKGEIGVSEFEHRQQEEIGVSPKRHQHKSVPSSSTQPEETSKLSLDGDDIMNYINKCDVNVTAKEDGHEVNLKKQHCIDMKDVKVQKRESTKEKAPVKRKRKKSKVLRSTYITKYDFGSKDVDNFDKEEKLKYTFDVKLSTEEDYAETFVVAKNEDAITNISNGFCILTGLPCHMIDEVYVLVNCGKEFYWVLTVIVLKERLIRVYDSLSSKRKKEPPIEIPKLAVMLLIFL
ncbi:hypothetical protein BC332_34094 [Capsicum chinense]|nr:hypothetical protein BC332_34094 [Capsicum chinense]